jgi:hypothetical protein
MPTSTFFAHITERLFGEWSEFLTGDALAPDESAPRAARSEPASVELEAAEAA